MDRSTPLGTTVADGSSRLRITLPAIGRSDDPLDALVDRHDAVRDVLAWIPTIGADARHTTRDARWLRAFLDGPLAFQLADVQAVLLPRLERLATEHNSSWLEACVARARRSHVNIDESARGLRDEVAPMCAGAAVAQSFERTASRATRSIDDALAFEDDIIIPTARLFLDAGEREAMRAELIAREERRERASFDAAGAGDAPVVRAVRAVRVRRRDGLDIVRSFATCPRGGSIDVAQCAQCPHLDDLAIAPDGRGTVACAVDVAPFAELRVGDVMTRDVACIERGAPLLDAAALLHERGVTGLPVVDGEGRAVGVVSQTDVVRALAERLDVAGAIVADVMMHAPFLVRESSALVDAARLLVLEGVHRLPVVNERNVVVGVVSALDLVRVSLAASCGASAA